MLHARQPGDMRRDETDLMIDTEYQWDNATSAVGLAYAWHPT